jgi:hypothetical protein
LDPADVLRSIRAHLETARFAVEDERGHYRYTDPFPDATIGLDSEHVDFDELLAHPATRVVVISPDHDTEDFLAIVEAMGLQRVSYAIGWTAWLDIAADGVNKATAAEPVRAGSASPGSGSWRWVTAATTSNCSAGRPSVVVVSPWGQSPAEVMEAAGERTGTVHEDGLAHVLASL